MARHTDVRSVTPEPLLESKGQLVNPFPSRRDVCHFLLAAGAAPLAFAQDAAYPSRPIRIIIGAPAGGAGDQMARMMGDEMTRAWGQPSIVESKPGANQAIGMSAVAKAAPDGYTLFAGSTAYTLNLALRKDAGYGSNDLIPVCHLANTPVVMVVPAHLKVETMEQFVALARSQQGKLGFGSTGVGSAPHFNGAMLNLQAGTNLIHVPYKGESALLTDLIAGELSTAWITFGTALPLLKAGKLKVISVSGDTRLPAMPSLPTSTEAGYPLLSGYFGFWTTAGTPPAVVEKLSREMARFTKSTEVSRRLVEFGFAPVGGTSEQFKGFLAEEFKRWKAASVATGITLD